MNDELYERLKTSSEHAILQEPTHTIVVKNSELWRVLLALEKHETGMAPVQRDDKHFYCLRCGKRLELKHRPAYCPKCGQKVGWRKPDETERKAD